MMKIFRRIILATLLLAVILTAALFYHSHPSSLLLINAHVINPKSKTETVRHLLLKEGRIEKVFTTIPEGLGVTQIDLTGKWIVPAFVDLHTHSWGQSLPNESVEFIGHLGTAKRMAKVGVLSFLDLFADENYVFRTRTAQRLLGKLGFSEYSDIFAAGPIFTCTRGHGTEYQIRTRVVDSAAEAASEIKSLISSRHPDVIKIAYDHARKSPGMNLSTMRALVSGAKANGLKTIIHIGTWADARDAVLAGADVITHMYEQDIPDDLVALMKERHTICIPTMTVQSDFLNMTRDPGILNSELLKSIEPSEKLETYNHPLQFSRFAKNWLGWQQANAASYRYSLQKLYKAGVRILIGTDSGNLGVFQGYSVHREMRLLTEAGISTMDALAGATTLAGEFLGMKWGVNEGDEANLVILDQSPLTDIKNTETIHFVVHHGFIDR